MKLYATITSERATKGQGGNEYLFIIVKDEKQETIFELQLQSGYYRFWNNSNFKPWNENTPKEIQQKAKRQKGDIWDVMEKEFPKGFKK